MAVQIALPDVFPSAGNLRRTATAPGATARRGLLARCGEWLRNHSDAARLREMEPHLARDISVATGGGDRGPEGFALDPRPLWGIGLTPQPMDAAPPWSGNRRSA